jgi:hypothetical protein
VRLRRVQVGSAVGSTLMVDEVTLHVRDIQDGKVEAVGLAIPDTRR